MLVPARYAAHPRTRSHLPQSWYARLPSMRQDNAPRGRCTVAGIHQSRRVPIQMRVRRGSRVHNCAARLGRLSWRPRQSWDSPRRRFCIASTRAGIGCKSGSRGRDAQMDRQQHVWRLRLLFLFPCALAVGGLGRAPNHGEHESRLMRTRRLACPAKFLQSPAALAVAPRPGWRLSGIGRIFPP